MRVLDVGCGPGTYVRALRARGHEAVGVDMDPMLATSEHLVCADVLDDDFPAVFAGYDLTLCLEVAEHVPAQYAERLVAHLVQTAPRLLFSAAQPGQGGAGHVNLQPRTLWLNLFARHGYVEDEAGTQRLLAFMREGPHMGWFTQNAVLLTSYGRLMFGRIEREEAPQAERLAAYLSELEAH